MHNAPIAYIVFNRPRHTRETFAAICAQKPARLFIIADGPRPGHPTDVERCQEVRAIVEDIDWPCQVQRNYADRNLGCKQRVITGLNWVFSQVESAIVLEDDCLPHPDFFGYCETLLDYYKDDDRVMVVTGNNFQEGLRRGTATYYFSKYNHVWGWATWRRAWRKIDPSLSFWPDWKKSSEWMKHVPEHNEQSYWAGIFDQMYRNEIDTWDYLWTASVWYHKGLTATPNVNLVSNIGFGPEGTHTVLGEDKEGLPVYPLGPLIHPLIVERDSSADRFVFEKLFGKNEPKSYSQVVHSLRKRLEKLFKRVIPETMFNKSPENISLKLIPKITKHKKMISGKQFLGLPDFCFVFQTFNKGHLVEQLLKPFLSNDIKNIILFADGCADDTIKNVRYLLTGKNHLIVNSNDVHEIRNYRTAVSIASEIFDCKYVVLLQDDDLYEENLGAWIESCRSLMDRYKDLAIIGLNGGVNPVGPCMLADDSIQSCLYEAWNEEGRVFYRLGEFEVGEVSDIKHTRDGTNWDFCSIVNRAPQVIRIDFLKRVDCFPLNMCPYQYDDYFNCLSAWANGWKVIHMPVSGIKRNVGIGGMRLVNNVTATSRPVHFKDNWNRVVEAFGSYWESVVTDVERARNDK